MASRRLFDAAKLLGASRSVAKQHLNLRSQQLELFTETSTLAKAVKDQTDRVTLTARAALSLAQRFNESTETQPSYTWAKGEPSTSGPIPRKETITGSGKTESAQEGLTQDHHYGQSESNASLDPPPKGNLDVQQEHAKRYPFPDGTIPQDGAQLSGTATGEDTFLHRPEPEPPKQPLAQEQQENEQKIEDKIQPVSSTESTIPLPEKVNYEAAAHARVAQREAESQIPAAVADAQPKIEDQPEEDVFHFRSPTTSPDYSNLPRMKIPKKCGWQQENQLPLQDYPINPDTFTAPSASTLKTQKAEEPAIAGHGSVPEGVNLNVFRTAKVSRMLGVDSSNPNSKLLKRKGAVSNTADRSLYENRKTQGISNGEISTAAEEPEKSLEFGESGDSEARRNEMHQFATELTQQADPAKAPFEPDTTHFANQNETNSYQLRESRVPSSRFGRLWQYGGLATGMAFGAVSESFRRITGTSDSSDSSSLMLSPRNMERLVAKLSRMRGAALKLGQMVSFQDLKMLPAPIHEVLQRVQDSADYMPASQRDEVLSRNLGPDWRSLFYSFDDVPMAAASIGQVHKAVLRSSGKQVAVKVQFPGVAASIDSDLNNLSILLTASRLLPKGLFLDKTIANARVELGWECDYTREAAAQRRFCELLKDDTDTFSVPKVVDEASGPQVLTADLMTGTAITKIPTLNQSQRDWLGTHILRLCLREITEFRFMQTDPNWTNFLFNSRHSKIELLDFGASREYPESFIDPYVKVLIAASRGDRSGVHDLSLKLGYLTGHESKAMAEAHIDSVVTLAEPFTNTAPEVYDFRDQTITDRVRSLIPVMLRERLAPPPEETYSLHRKLSGAFLLCARLGSRVKCRDMFSVATDRYFTGELSKA